MSWECPYRDPSAVLPGPGPSRPDVLTASFRREGVGIASPVPGPPSRGRRRHLPAVLAGGVALPDVASRRHDRCQGAARPRALQGGRRADRIGRPLHRPEPDFGRLRQVPDHARRTGRSGHAGTWATPTPSQTPRNQETVAAGKFTSLYRWLGSLAAGRLLVADRLVSGPAAGRRTRGPTSTGSWPSLQGGGPRHGDRTARTRRPCATASTVADRLHAARGSRRHIAATPATCVRYATSSRRQRDLHLHGSAVSIWYGPTGPTRGKARGLPRRQVREDGRPHRTLVRRRGPPWSSGRAGRRAAGTRLTIVVVGTQRSADGRHRRVSRSVASGRRSAAAQRVGEHLDLDRGSPRPARSRRPSPASAARSGSTRGRPCSSPRTR